MKSTIKHINRFIFIFLAIWLPFMLMDSFLTMEIPLLGRFWDICYHIILKFVMPGTVFLLDVLGYDVHHTYDLIWITGSPRSLQIGHACLALDLMVMLAALIIAYPGHKKSKYWIIPLGCLFIQLLNIGRLALLTVSIKARYLSSFEREHHYFFKFAVYLLIFIIWALWIKYFPAGDEPEEKKAVS